MRNIILVILSLLIFQSCGKTFQNDKIIRAKADFEQTDPYFDVYKIEFEEEYYNQTGKTIDTEWIPINFSESTFENMGNTVGVCHYTEHNGNFRALEIIIKTSNWEFMDSSCRKFLIAHELGHCILNKDHIDSHPAIMNSKITYCETYSGLARFFNAEFFHNDLNAIEILKYYLQ